jgi:lactam utilization protein B
MAGSRDSAAYIDALNQHEASIMLLALSGSKACRRMNAEELQLIKLQRGVEAKLQLAKKRLQTNLLHNPPRIRKKDAARMQQRGYLQEEIVSLEAKLVALQAEARFFALNPNACSQYILQVSGEAYPSLPA